MIGVVFKLFHKFDINILYAIVVNYLVCVITGSIYLGYLPISLDSVNQPWFVVAAILGFVFVSVFNLYGNTVKHFGIVVATIFQKMSMLAPAIVAILWYNEQLSLIKAIGILIGIFAIGFLSYQKKEIDHNHISQPLPLKYWLLPLGTFLGSCLIDSTLFLLEAEKIAPSGDIPFVIHLFFFAFIAGLVLLAVNRIKDKTKLRRKDVVAGILLGVPNFFSIYSLLLVISSGWEASVVFPINNVGILSVSALIGFLVFKEKLTINKIIGLSMSIIAIILLSQ